MIDIRRQMIQNLNRQMAQRLLRALEQFARVGLGKRYPQVLARGLPGRLVYFFDQVWVVDVCIASECFEMADQAD